MSLIKARALCICELHGKPIDPNSLISPRLTVLAMGWSWSLIFANELWFTLRASLVFRNSPHYVTGELRFHSHHVHHSTLHTWTMLLASRSFKLTNSPTVARASDLYVHLVTRASSKDECLGLSFDGVCGRFSVKNRVTKTGH